MANTIEVVTKEMQLVRNNFDLSMPGLPSAAGLERRVLSKTADVCGRVAARPETI
jgi:hypothetical protein